MQSTLLKGNATTVQVEGQGVIKPCSSPMAAGVQTMPDIITTEERQQTF